jgi:hypothetical protein
VKLGAAAGALRSSRQTTLVCVNTPPVGASVCVCHFTFTAEITDTCFPSLYINLQLAQIDDINQSFLCTLWLFSPHEQQKMKWLRDRWQKIHP